MSGCKQFPGLLLDQSPTGESNGAVIQDFLAKNRLPFTVESLNSAVRLAKGLIWTSGFGPNGAVPAAPAATPRKKDRFNDGIDSGQGAPQRDPTDTHAWRAANKVDTTKLFEDRQAAEAARAQAEVDERQEWADTHQTFYYDGTSNAAGRINHPKTNAANAAGRAKWAAKRGITLAAPTSVRELPDWDSMTNAEKRACSPDLLKRIIAKNQLKGRGH